MLKTRITELFDITHPIIQGGMHYVGFAEMAAPVSNAGGLGIITGLTQKSPVDLANEIAKCHKLTDKPFGVNLTFLPGFVEPDYPGYIKAIVEGGVKIVETAGRSPEKYMDSLKSAGIKVIHKCTSVRHSLKAEKIGCDAASVDGFECGGHPGEDDIPNMILLPRAAEELSIPFVASGGMGNGQQLAAALSMGADGINMGTRFIATDESIAVKEYKEMVINSKSTDLRLTNLFTGANAYYLKDSIINNNLDPDNLETNDKGFNISGSQDKISAWKDIWSAGQGVGFSEKIESLEEITLALEDEWKKVKL